LAEKVKKMDIFELINVDASRIQQNIKIIFSSQSKELTVLHLLARNSFIAMAFCPYIMGDK
jgi:hypothetical protein